MQLINIITKKLNPIIFSPQVRTKIIRKRYYISVKTNRNRVEKGLSANPNGSGVLTDSPDYTYLDGRITPLGQGQRARILKNEDSKQKIIELSKEIDFAIERYKQLKIDEYNKKQDILDRKLKPKGEALANN